jgi:hypothetical protein
MSGGSGDYAIEPGTRDHMHVQFNSHEAAERYHAMIHAKDAAKVAHGGGWADPPVLPGHLRGKSDPINPSFIPSWQKGLFREGVFAPPKDRSLGQEVRREPGSLLRASNQMQASALKHEISGSASLHVKLASGLAPVSGVKTKGDLFKEIRLDRAPVVLSNTMG